MRKRNVTHVADTIFWWVIYALPIILFVAVTIAYICACGNIDGNFTSGDISWFPEDFAQSGLGESGSGSISSYFDVVAFDAIMDCASMSTIFMGDYFFSQYFILLDTPIYTAFTSAWDMILPDSSGSFSVFICGSMTWFICAHIIHIFVDFIVFIPRLCHKWMGKATQED